MGKTFILCVWSRPSAFRGRRSVRVWEFMRNCVCEYWGLDHTNEIWCFPEKSAILLVKNKKGKKCFTWNILRKGITDGNRFKGNDGNGRSGNRLWGTASSFRRCHYTPDRQKAGGTSGDRTAIWGRAVKQCIVCRGRLPELKWIFAVFWSAVETFADKGRY